MLTQTFSNTAKLFLLIFFLIISVNLKAQDPVHSKNGMVVSASKLATNVGVDILKRGGNAIDAAVAVGFALAVTYPSAGNLGGGGFMVIHLSNGSNTTIDFRETAPYKATENMFLDSSGNVNINLSQFGVTSAGVPGSVAGLIYVLEKYGTLNLTEVIQPAIDFAENGFEVEYRFAKSLESELDNFNRFKSTSKIFTDSGRAIQEGTIFVQKDLANTLKRIRDFGNDGFYKGTTAELIVKQIEKDGGFISKQDLVNYKPIERLPIQTTYRGLDVITMGPPSGGGVTLLEMLNILENYNFDRTEWGSSDYIHKLIESMKFAFADRSKFIGDPSYFNVPLTELISKDYAKKLYDRIKSEAVLASDIIPGSSFYKPESKETTHYCVTDKFGNVVSTTTTINSSYGSKVVVEGAGFLLNNEMDDFSSKPGVPNQFGLTGSEANKIQPGKRMLSSMSPTIMLKNNKPFLTLGSPGGSTIPTVVLQVILNVVDFNMDIQKAINMCRIHHQWLPDSVYYEQFCLSSDVIKSLKEKKQNIGSITSLGRVEGIQFNEDNHLFLGATDPRGYGEAKGY